MAASEPIRRVSVELKFFKPSSQGSASQKSFGYTVLRYLAKHLQLRDRLNGDVKAGVDQEG